VIGLVCAGLVAAASAGPRARSAETTAPPETAKAGSLNLHDYELKIGPVTVEGVKNASGLAWNPDTRTVFLVMNKPKRLVELTPDGKKKRVISLSGFNDTEGVCYLGEGNFAVAEEKRRKLVVFKVTDDATEIKYPTESSACIDPEPAGNSGLEGVAYDPAARVFFGVKEKDPRRVYRVSRGEVEKGKSDCSNPWDAEKDELRLKDQSDIFFHPGTGHLLVLSHESFCLVECTLEGKEISRLKLTAGSAGLEKDVPQAEGVTMDGQGTLYLCSERNLFYVFVRKGAEPKAGH
jgi:uncharacterized protein YjiK